MRMNAGNNGRKAILAAVLSAWPVFAAAETTTYMYTDSLGSVLARTNSIGSITRTSEYRPYGQQIVGSASESSERFAGHVIDESGFTYMQSRYYDSDSARFVSIDPVYARPADLFNFNSYAYGALNPIRNIDPTGREVCGVYSCEISNSHWNDGDTGGSQAGGRYTIAFDGAGDHLADRSQTENASLDAFMADEGGKVVDGGLVFSGTKGRAEAAAAANWKTTHVDGHVNVFGYSRGGVAAVHMVNSLAKKNVTTNLLVLFDPVAAHALSVNPSLVTTALNYYQRNTKTGISGANPFNGVPVEGARNVQLTSLPGYGEITHLNIVDAVTDRENSFRGDIDAAR